MSVEMGCAMRMKAMSMVFCALFVIGALGATPSAFALDGRAEVSNAFAYNLNAPFSSIVTKVKPNTSFVTLDVTP